VNYQDFQEAVLIAAGAPMRDLMSFAMAGALLLTFLLPGLSFMRRMLARARP
jgi:hypothetical protein